MDNFHSLIRILHVAAGVGTLVVGPVAIWFNFRRPRQHRLFGQVFQWSMAWVCLSALFGFAMRPEKPFFQFLAGIALFTILGVAKAVRSMRFRMRRAQPGPADTFIIWSAFLTGLAMVGTGVFYFTKEGGLTLGILFTAFGLGTALLGRDYRRVISKGPNADPRLWYRKHVSGMMGAFIASNTAFLVNTTSEWLHPLLQFLLPTVLLVPVIMYFTKKLGLRPQDLKGL